MKRIASYRSLLGVDEKADLQELKTVYRNLMKSWHPDKFREGDVLKDEAEAKSKHIIEAYHFLVGISPETLAQSAEVYKYTISSSGIADFEYNAGTLLIKFSNGSSYEYFGVPRPVYIKLVNAPNAARFARRHIYDSYTYRNLSKAND